MRSRHLSQVIAASPEAVYAYASDPDNLPRWAAGLARSEVVREGDSLMVDSPMGQVTVTFTPRNEYGVIDHDVRLPSGEITTVPVRIIAHPDGAEIVFTIRQGDLTAEQFDRDAAAVQQDLDALKRLLEATAQA